MSLTQTDRAALALAIECARVDPAVCQQIEARFAAGDDWVTVAKACAYHCQIEALGLQPWQSPPCYADAVDDPDPLRQPFGDTRGARESAELLLRMTQCGVSRWHPSPLHACLLAEGEAEHVARRLIDGALAARALGR